MACLPSSNGLCFLVRPHQARIAGHIGGEDRGKTAGRGHGCGSPRCSRLSLSTLYQTTHARRIFERAPQTALNGLSNLDPQRVEGAQIESSHCRDLRYRQPYDRHNRIVLSRRRVPLSGRENHRMELAMPDLDLIKQAEQVCGTGARLPRAAPAIPTAGSASAATTLTASPSFAWRLPASPAM
jgi:hypothetical protein